MHHWDSDRKLEPCTPEPRRLCLLSRLLKRLASPPERTSQQRQAQPSLGLSAGGNVFCSIVGLLRPRIEYCKKSK